MIKPLSELAPGEPLFDKDLAKVLSVRHPERFPVIARITEFVNGYQWRQGVLFAYLCVRFPDPRHRRFAWQVRSYGPNGSMARQVLNTQPDNDGWEQAVLKLIPGETPVRERVFLAWIENAVPKELCAGYPEFKTAIAMRPIQRSRLPVDQDMRRRIRSKNKYT